MNRQTKAILLIAGMAVVFVAFMISGSYLDRGDRPEPSEKEAEAFRESKWAKRLEKPISWFTPAIAPDELRFSPSLRAGCRFIVASDADTAFRSLNLSIEPLAGSPGQAAECGFNYRADGSSIEALKEQSGSLEGPADKTALAVEKSGGRLELEPGRGTRVIMTHGSDTTWICEQSSRGVLSVNPLFRQQP